MTKTDKIDTFHSSCICNQCVCYNVSIRPSNSFYAESMHTTLRVIGVYELWRTVENCSCHRSERVVQFLDTLLVWLYAMVIRTRVLP